MIFRGSFNGCRCPAWSGPKIRTAKSAARALAPLCFVSLCLPCQPQAWYRPLFEDAPTLEASDAASPK